VSCVIDASVTLAWLLQDEHTPQSDRFFGQVAESGAIVPTLWRLEVANGLQWSVRRERINRKYRDASLASLKALPIEVDSETDAQAWENTLQLAERYELTLYDAAYLELALRRQLALATRDHKLADAARAASVVVVLTT
jgi:predicted nucleic acid-binding protein